MKDTWSIAVIALSGAAPDGHAAEPALSSWREHVARARTLRRRIARR